MTHQSGHASFRSAPLCFSQSGARDRVLTLTMSRGWMMHVAPMPERPPFMNGLMAFQVALSPRDMAGGRWKIADESGRRFEGSEGQRWVIAKTGARPQPINSSGYGDLYRSTIYFLGSCTNVWVVVPENVPILFKQKRERAHMGKCGRWKRKTVYSEMGPNTAKQTVRAAHPAREFFVESNFFLGLPPLPLGPQIAEGRGLECCTSTNHGAR